MAGIPSPAVRRAKIDSVTVDSAGPLVPANKRKVWLHLAIEEIDGEMVADDLEVIPGDTVVVSGVIPLLYNGKKTVTDIGGNAEDGWMLAFEGHDKGPMLNTRGVVVKTSYTGPTAKALTAVEDGDYVKLTLDKKLEGIAIGDTITVANTRYKNQLGFPMNPGYDGVWEVVTYSDFSVTFRKN